MSQLQDSFRYDAAFSFLSKDLPLARQLADALDPPLATFVYARNKEDLLGQDGMDRFASVFRLEARLTVILYRQGWGQTPWTAFEEVHIRDRALHARMTSFMVLRLDEAPMPTWVPDTHLYASTGTESHSDLLAVIRVRARQQGASLAPATAAEFALREKRTRDAKLARDQRANSHHAVEEIRDELTVLFAEITRIVNEIKAGDPTFDIQVGAAGDQCAIASEDFSTSLVWIQPIRSALSHARLRVNDWRSRVRLPTPSDPRAAGVNCLSAVHYTPSISEDETWIWRWSPELDEPAGGGGLVLISTGLREAYSTKELANHLVKRHVRKAMSSE